MLILYHSLAVRHRRNSQQLLQVDQVLAAHGRKLGHHHRATNGPIKHPPRHLGRLVNIFPIQLAPEYGRVAPHQRTANRHRLAEPRMPRITNLPAFGNMGFVLSTCINSQGLTSALIATHRYHVASSLRPMGGLSRCRTSVGCITATAERPDGQTYPRLTTTCIPSSNSATLVLNSISSSTSRARRSLTRSLVSSLNSCPAIR